MTTSFNHLFHYPEIHNSDSIVFLVGNGHPTPFSISSSVAKASPCLFQYVSPTNSHRTVHLPDIDANDFARYHNWLLFSRQLPSPQTFSSTGHPLERKLTWPECRPLLTSHIFACQIGDARYRAYIQCELDKWVMPCQSWIDEIVSYVFGNEDATEELRSFLVNRMFASEEDCPISLRAYWQRLPSAATRYLPLLRPPSSSVSSTSSRALSEHNAPVRRREKHARLARFVFGRQPKVLTRAEVQRVSMSGGVKEGDKSEDGLIEWGSGTKAIRQQLAVASKKSSEMTLESDQAMTPEGHHAKNITISECDHGECSIQGFFLEANTVEKSAETDIALPSSSGWDDIFAAIQSEREAWGGTWDSSSTDSEDNAEAVLELITSYEDRRPPEEGHERSPTKRDVESEMDSLYAPPGQERTPSIYSHALKQVSVDGVPRAIAELRREAENETARAALEVPRQRELRKRPLPPLRPAAPSVIESQMQTQALIRLFGEPKTAQVPCKAESAHSASLSSNSVAALSYDKPLPPLPQQPTEPEAVDKVPQLRSLSHRPHSDIIAPNFRNDTRHRNSKTARFMGLGMENEKTVVAKRMSTQSQATGMTETDSTKSVPGRRRKKWKKRLNSMVEVRGAPSGRPARSVQPLWTPMV